MVNYKRDRSWFFTTLKAVLLTPSTRDINDHFTDEEWNSFVNGLPVDSNGVINWPEKPIHAPYATKGTGFYCQKKVGARFKYDLHRLAAIYGYMCEKNVTLQSGFTDEEWDDLLSKEASHVLEGYPGSQRNFNPRHLTMESGMTNKSRLGCCYKFIKLAANSTGIDNLWQLYEEGQDIFAPDFQAQQLAAYVQGPPPTPGTLGASTWAASSNCPHEPKCCFWMSHWGTINPAVPRKQAFGAEQE